MLAASRLRGLIAFLLTTGMCWAQYTPPSGGGHPTGHGWRGPRRHLSESDSSEDRWSSLRAISNYGYDQRRKYFERRTGWRSRRRHGSTRRAHGEQFRLAAFSSCITSAYDSYQIEFVSLVPATNSVNIGLQGSTNGGSGYDTGSDYQSLVLQLVAGGTGDGSST